MPSIFSAAAATNPAARNSSNRTAPGTEEGAVAANKSRVAFAISSAKFATKAGARRIAASCAVSGHSATKRANSRSPADHSTSLASILALPFFRRASLRLARQAR